MPNMHRASTGLKPEQLVSPGLEDRIFSVVLQLQSPEPTEIPATGGHFAHALFLSLVAQVDPVLATELHDRPDYKPFTVSALNGPLVPSKERTGYVRLQSQSVYWLRFTLLDARLWGSFMSRLLLSGDLPRLRIGPAYFVVCRVMSAPEHTGTPSGPASGQDPRQSRKGPWEGWACNCRWSELVRAVEHRQRPTLRLPFAGGRMRIGLRFYSPTAFSLSAHTPGVDPSGLQSGGGASDDADDGDPDAADPGMVIGPEHLQEKSQGRSFPPPVAQPGWGRLGGKRMEVWPRPELVFGSLARTWSLYSPLALPLDRDELVAMTADAVVMSRYELRTQMLQFPKHKQVGFVGYVIYECVAGGPLAAALDLLADFALYAGVGYKTTMGMGQTRRMDVEATTGADHRE